MDFDKLKKAAMETIKIMSAKEEEAVDDKEVTEEEQHDDPDLLGSTQRIDFKTILERFRTKHDDDDDEPVNAEPQQPTPAAEPAPIHAEAMDELAKTVDEIDKRTEEITIAADENNEKLSASLVTLKTEIDTSIDSIKQDLGDLRRIIEKFDEKADDSYSSVSAKFNNTEKKIEKLTNSLSGVAKLNDSIFDLKNSQMNTKNTLGDLEASFYSLKRKMTMGVLLISIISAVVAVLEVVNLLS